MNARARVNVWYSLSNMYMYVLVFERFEPKCREARKTTIISSSKEPLEKSPQEAEGEELAERSHLFPIRDVKSN